MHLEFGERECEIWRLIGWIVWTFAMHTLKHVHHQTYLVVYDGICGRTNEPLARLKIS